MNWTYDWTPGSSGDARPRSGRHDDSGSLQNPGPGVTVDVVARTCLCSVWDNSVTPPAQNTTPGGPARRQFRSDEDSFITGVRFYKGVPGHRDPLQSSVVREWALLAEAQFTGRRSAVIKDGRRRVYRVTW